MCRGVDDIFVRSHHRNVGAALVSEFDLCWETDVTSRGRSRLFEWKHEEDLSVGQSHHDRFLFHCSGA